MLENVIPDFAEIEKRMLGIANAGYTLALNIRHFTPEFYRSIFPDRWIHEYTRARYVLFDPVTIWSAANTGTTRWSEINLPLVSKAGSKILNAAAAHGLRFGGLAVTRSDDGRGAKCLLSVARNDRELTDDELRAVEALLELLTNKLGSHAGLSGEELETLRLLATGMTHEEAAVAMDVSAGAVKKRLERARKVLGARNVVHAVAIATKRGLILPTGFM